ncbi:MAG: SAM-dependent methyltransferase [Myxococcaceae bacterium]|nr:SAM-dependent methyltransferase [Myxococcaceae bacterium]
MGDARRSAPSVEGNREALLAALRRALPRRGLVLEVGSGTGQHAVYLGAALPELEWQPSEVDAGARASIAAWVFSSRLRNVHMPLALDASEAPWPVSEADAVLAVDLIHAAHWDATVGLIAGARVLLPDDGPLVVHGPLRVGDKHVARLDALDAALRAADPAWGVRSLAGVRAAAAKLGFRVAEVTGGDAVDATLVLRKGR